MMQSLIYQNATFLVVLALASIGFLALALIVERLSRRVSAANRHTIVFSALLLPAVLLAAAILFPSVDPVPEPAGAAVAIAEGAALVRAETSVDLVPILMSLWLTGVLASLARSGRSALHWRRVARLAEGQEGFAVSTECGEPMVIGILKPLIVLPAGDYLGSLSAAEREAVFAHEKAHMERRDNLVALLVQVSCAFFWFDPLHRLARRRLVALREQACDEVVLDRGCDADSYVAALARSCEAPFRSSAVACMSRLQLRERMESIMTYHAQHRYSARLIRAGIVTAITVAAVAFAVLAPSPSIGAAEASGTENLDFTAQVTRNASLNYVVRLEGAVVSTVVEFARVPDVRTMTSRAGNRTYKWTIQLNSDGSGMATLDLSEGESILGTSSRILEAPVSSATRPEIRRLDSSMQPPKVISRVEPVYPAEAKENRIAGVVILELTINEDGSVSDLRVLKPLPFGLDQAALDAVRQWRFEPAMLDGKPVPVRFNITINFKLDHGKEPV